MTTISSPVSSIQHSDGRIDDTTTAGTGGTGERAVPYHCPYCAEEDLRPLGATPGVWHCRTCTRTFSVTYLGMVPPTPTWPTPGATPSPTGGTR
jgi:hypothetical protein